MGSLKQKDIHSLRFENLTLTFPGQDPILNRVDFNFPMDEIVWIKSTDGSGKSSLLQILSALNMPNSGRYLINDENIIEMSFEEFLPYRLSIGYTFDYGGLISNRTLYDNLMLPLVYHKIVSTEEANSRIQEVVRKFDLGKYIQERPAHVPGRVRKLGCLLRALITRPQVIVMDDPSVGVGIETQHILVDFLMKLRRDGFAKHVFMSSYDEQFMSFFSHEVVHLEGGILHSHTADGLQKMTKKLVNL